MTADVTDRHVVLTGANAGLGFATAVSLLEAGAKLTGVSGTRQSRRHAASAKSRDWQGGRSRRAHRPGLLTEVSKLCERLRTGQSIDVLINNAGALFNDCVETEEALCAVRLCSSPPGNSPNLC